MASLKHRRATPRNIALVNKFAKDTDLRIRHEICTDWRLDAESTASLFAEPDPVLRKKTLCALLGFLVAEREGRRFENYVKLYRAKARLIVSLAQDPDHAVRFAIASCKEAPPAAMKILFDDPEGFIREAVLAHDRWPYGVMLDLERNQKSGNESLFHGLTTPSSSALRLLAASRNPFLRLLVVRCKRTPVAEIRKLTNDRIPEVRKAAERRLSKP